ncbi:YraN family protein [Yinghuangia sp. ASG 101]|uniref:YraN family protein n=1 Tax=Yinghuangia sp. ASG 101 TaxID=2896848 RepID=UPI001E3D7EA5|nr:YraN family protein [Yinghuangia sp. ASG 101]UGQ14113.1 YraN family protein [Yinghuangia sp. ASG 101]
MAENHAGTASRTADDETGAPRPSRSPRNTAVAGYGERVAERRLTEAGLVVVDRNWRCAAGELDLVALDRGVLVVCEVKTRRAAGFEHPCAAVGPDKAERLRRLAERWIAAHPHIVRPGGDVRIDLVAVVPSRRGAAHVEHVKGAC